MPLAFDLSSPLTSGSILPVATTDRAMSPFSTLASFEGSISRLGRSASARPKMVPASPTPATPKKIIRRRLRLLLWLPFIGLPRSRNSSCPMLKYEGRGGNVHSALPPLPKLVPDFRVPACLDGRGGKTSRLVIMRGAIQEGRAGYRRVMPESLLQRMLHLIPPPRPVRRLWEGGNPGATPRRPP